MRVALVQMCSTDDLAANLAAAELCNHTKKPPASWPARLERMKEREKKLLERVALRKADLQERREASARAAEPWL